MVYWLHSFFFFEGGYDCLTYNHLDSPLKYHVGTTQIASFCRDISRGHFCVFLWSMSGLMSRTWCLEVGVPNHQLLHNFDINHLWESVFFFPHRFPFLVLNHINQYKPHFFTVDAYDIMWPLKLRHAEEPDIQKISHEEKRLHLWRCQCPPTCRLPMVGMASGSGLGH